VHVRNAAVHGDAVDDEPEGQEGHQVVRLVAGVQRQAEHDCEHVSAQENLDQVFLSLSIL
jgi:hypothetical protein